MNYEAFQTYCATVWKIPNQLLITVRPWIEAHSTPQPPQGDEWGIYPTDDLGYAELSMITTVEQGLEEVCDTARGWQCEGADAYKRWLETGGREGHGVYRVLLKTYLLWRAGFDQDE